jgi:hypothetical protein
MTYRQLRDQLNQVVTEEQLNQDVTVWLMATEEFVPVVNSFMAEEDDDVLDKDHIALGIDW